MDRPPDAFEYSGFCPAASTGFPCQTCGSGNDISHAGNGSTEDVSVACGIVVAPSRTTDGHRGTGEGFNARSIVVGTSRRHTVSFSVFPVRLGGPSVAFREDST